MKTTFQLIFDNSGNANLQTEDYCHFYTDMYELAQATQAIHDGKFPERWDGNEPENRIDTDSGKFIGEYGIGAWTVYKSWSDILDVMEWAFAGTHGLSRNEQVFTEHLMELRSGVSE